MQLDRRLFDGKILSSIVYPEFFPILPTDDVVNIGCGLGPQAVAYKNAYKKMVGVDLMQERLDASKVLLAEHGVTDYETVCAPVEHTGLPENSFDKALAIDIIEHISKPEELLNEAHRILKPNGLLLVSVPAMHDHYVHLARFLGKLLGRKTTPLPHGHLDAHNSDLSLWKWKQMMDESQFKVVKGRATTLWPPLHLYGVPKFWFTNRFIHAIDSFLCRLPILKNCGQAYLFVLQKSI